MYVHQGQQGMLPTSLIFYPVHPLCTLHCEAHLFVGIHESPMIAWAPLNLHGFYSGPNPSAT